MRHEIKQSFQSHEDITVITHGRRRPIRLNLNALEEFRDREGLELPQQITVIIDQRSPLRRMREGDSFYNPQNTLRGTVEEALNVLIVGVSSPRRGIAQVQSWPFNLRTIQESILKHELQHVGNPNGRSSSARGLSLTTIGSVAYHFGERSFPIIPGLADNYIALGLGLGAVLGYNISPYERAAIKAQLRPLSEPLLIKDK